MPAGNVLAFFELPTKPPMGRDPNTPSWVQHIAFKVKDRDELLAFKTHLESNGVDVLGVTDHAVFHSIYFFDPNVTASSWRRRTPTKRRCSQGSKRSCGTCSKNGRAPSARQRTRRLRTRKSCFLTA